MTKMWWSSSHNPKGVCAYWLPVDTWPIRLKRWDLERLALGSQSNSSVPMPSTCVTNTYHGVASIHKMYQIQ